MRLRSSDGTVLDVHKDIVCTQSGIMNKLLVDTEAESHEVRGAATVITHAHHTNGGLGDH